MGEIYKDWARRQLNKKLLQRARAKDLSTREGREAFRILSEEVASKDRLKEVEKKALLEKHQDVDDPRILRNPHIGVMAITEVNPETGRLRYTRAPDVMSPDDVDLPDWAWSLSRDDRTEDEKQQAAREALARAFELEEVTLEQTLPYRIRVAYRLTREVARLKGLVEEDQTLAQALQPSSTCHDPWVVPTPCARGGDWKQAGLRALSSRAFEILQNAELVELLDQYTTHPQDEHDPPRLIGAGGLALLPPEIPLRWRDAPDWGVSENYTEKFDVMLKRWVALHEEIARYLTIERGSEEDRDLGRLGLIGLVDRETTRLLWPSRMQLIYWEEELIAETVELLTEEGTPKTRKRLREKHGLVRHEVQAMIRMALVRIRELAEGDLEDQRSLMVMRLENYIQRSREAMDLRNELAGIKQMALVLGLTKTDPEDALSAFGNLVKTYDEIDSANGILDVDFKQLPE